jgi:hypothetical protein
MVFEAEKGAAHKIINEATEVSHDLSVKLDAAILMNPCGHSLESDPCNVCGYPDPRVLIRRLRADLLAVRKEIEQYQKTEAAINIAYAKMRENIHKQAGESE